MLYRLSSRRKGIAVAAFRSYHLILSTLLLAATLAASTLLAACSSPSGEDVWFPTEADPVYTDEDGTTWGIDYNPPDAVEDFIFVSPDMVYSSNDDGVRGYVSKAENDAAIAEVVAAAGDAPGEYKAYVSLNLYAFLSDEVVGTTTFTAGSYRDYEKVEGTRNEWVPEWHLDTETTDDGLVWGWRGDAGEVDMEFVRATDTGEWGYIFDSDRYAAQEANFKARDEGVEDPTVMIDVVLFDSDVVVGQYAVTFFTPPVG